MDQTDERFDKAKWDAERREARRRAQALKSKLVDADSLEKLMKAESELVATIKGKEMEILEAFGKAFLAETGYKPSEVELVSRMDPSSLVWVFYFRPRGSDD